MSTELIIEIASRIQRRGHRIKNSENNPLYHSSKHFYARVRKSKTLEKAIELEKEFISIVKENYTVGFPIGIKIPAVFNMSGYEDPGENESDNDGSNDNNNTNENISNETNSDNSESLNESDNRTRSNENSDNDNNRDTNDENTKDVNDNNESDYTSEQVKDSDQDNNDKQTKDNNQDNEDESLDDNDNDNDDESLNKPDEESDSDDQDENDKQELNNTNNSNSNNDTTDENEEDKFNVDAAISALNSNAGSTYSGHCAKNIREALEAGYADTTGHPVDAKDYGPLLENNGFSEVDNSAVDAPHVGDVIVIQPTEDGKHPHGHIAMFNGEKWVSDTVQRDHTGGVHGSFKVYRHD